MTLLLFPRENQHHQMESENTEAEMIRIEWGILGINSTRRKGQGTITINYRNVFHYSGDYIATQYGVIILLAALINKYVKSFLPVNALVMLIKSNGQPFDVYLVQIYAPTTESTEEEMEEFYANIRKAQKHMKNSDVNVLMGDWNSKVGAEKLDGMIGPFGLIIKNDRVRRFVCKKII